MEYVTKQQFLKLLWQKYDKRKSMEMDDFVLLGRQKGFLDAKDFLQVQERIARQDIARILHLFLKLELLEADERDICGAECLKDLYDCHTCVGHVAQMHVKGIMEPLKELSSENGQMNYVFGMKEGITVDVCDSVLLRIFQKEKRVMPVDSKIQRANKTTYETVLKKLNEKKLVCLVDVRDLKAYEKAHIPGAIQFSLSDLLEHPLGVSKDKRAEILVYCKNGVLSQIAADCLKDAGYEHVSYFALERL